MTQDPMKNTLATLERGLITLEFVAAHGPCTAKRVAREVGLKTSTCYHVLRTLVATGFLHRLDDGTYDVGPRSHNYVRSVHGRFSVRPELLIILTRLHNTTRETAYISGWKNGTFVLQHYLAGLHPLNVGRLDIGYSGDMHARASCKAVLAHLPDEHVTAMFAGVKLHPVTANTITQFDEFRMELVQTRSQGYAIDREEFVEGVFCVAAPFFKPSGTPAGAYTVSVPAERFQRTKSKLISHVIEAGEIATQFLATGRLTIEGAVDGFETSEDPARATGRASPENAGLRPGQNLRTPPARPLPMEKT